MYDMPDNYYKDKKLSEGLGDKKYDTARDSSVSKEMPVGQDILLSIEKQLEEQANTLDHLRARLSPILNYKEARAERANPDKAVGLYSPLVNTLMSYSDMISSHNRTLREILEAVEV